MIDITRPHRDNYTEKFLCRLYRRKLDSIGDNQTLSYEEQYISFLAQEASSRDDDTDTIMDDSIQMPYQTTSIATTDPIGNVNKNDKIYYNGFYWIVTGSKKGRLISKSLYREVYQTIINLRR